jgi:hypothetical protein
LKSRRDIDEGGEVKSGVGVNVGDGGVGDDVVEEDKREVSLLNGID